MDFACALNMSTGVNTYCASRNAYLSSRACFWIKSFLFPNVFNSPGFSLFRFLFRGYFLGNANLSFWAVVFHCCVWARARSWKHAFESACVRVCTQAGLGIKDSARPKFRLRGYFRACFCMLAVIAYEPAAGQKMSGFWTDKFKYWARAGYFYRLG